MASLQELSLEYNKLRGSLPPEWGSGLSRLEKLTLNTNALEGVIPSSWGNGMTGLRYVYLYGNKGLQGCLPRVWRARLNPGAVASVQYWVFDGTRLQGFCAV